MERTAAISYALDKLYTPIHMNIACFEVYFKAEETKVLNSVQLVGDTISKKKKKTAGKMFQKFKIKANQQGMQ